METPEPTFGPLNLTEDEFNETLDRLFLKHTGRTYREDEPPAPPAEAESDSLQRIMRDFPTLFGTA